MGESIDESSSWLRREAPSPKLTFTLEGNTKKLSCNSWIKIPVFVVCLPKVVHLSFIFALKTTEVIELPITKGALYWVGFRSTRWILRRTPRLCQCAWSGEKCFSSKRWWNGFKDSRRITSIVNNTSYRGNRWHNGYLHFFGCEFCFLPARWLRLPAAWQVREHLTTATTATWITATTFRHLRVQSHWRIKGISYLSI